MTKILRPRETALKLGVSLMTVWRWERAGVLPPKLRLGPNTVGFIADDIDEFIQSRPRAPRRTAAERDAAKPITEVTNRDGYQRLATDAEHGDH
jgi:predicted DNA-binding transcriptional regulator AlpA